MGTVDGERGQDMAMGAVRDNSAGLVGGVAQGHTLLTSMADVSAADWESKHASCMRRLVERYTLLSSCRYVKNIHLLGDGLSRDLKMSIGSRRFLSDADMEFFA